MKVRTLLAVSLALAFAAGAYAQDNSPAANAPADAAPAASTDKAASDTHHHAMKKHHARHHGHAPGDPPVVDHSDDHLIVTPTETRIAVPSK
jgi:nitrate reductase cytochrome c-type subunit